MTDLHVHPLTADRWPDLERLFGERGACGGCWCMWWRLSRMEFDAGKGAANREALRAIVGRGDPPGLLGYLDDEPVAWCAIGPRGDYPRLAGSRILKPVDDRPVWSVTCLFVAKPIRRRGFSVTMLRAAARYAATRGARLVEGYPHDLDGATLPDPFVYTGLISAFLAAGFAEVARRSPKRPIMRLALDPRTFGA